MLQVATRALIVQALRKKEAGYDSGFLQFCGAQLPATVQRGVRDGFWIEGKRLRAPFKEGSCCAFWAQQEEYV